jgi:hypothetical protein
LFGRRRYDVNCHDSRSLTCEKLNTQPLFPGEIKLRPCVDLQYWDRHFFVRLEAGASIVVRKWAIMVDPRGSTGEIGMFSGIGL